MIRKTKTALIREALEKDPTLDSKSLAQQFKCSVANVYQVKHAMRSPAVKAAKSRAANSRSVNWEDLTQVKVVAEKLGSIQKLKACVKLLERVGLQ